MELLKYVLLPKEQKVEYKNLLNELGIKNDEEILQSYENFEKFIKYGEREGTKEVFDKVYDSIGKNQELMTKLFQKYIAVVRESLEHSTKCSIKTKEYFTKQIDKLMEMASDSRITKEERQVFIEIIKENNQMMYKLDENDKNFFLKVIGLASLVVIGVAGAIISGNRSSST